MPREWEREMRRGRWDDRDRGPAANRDDLGQADYSTDYAYDPQRRAGYRAADEMGREADDYGQADYSSDYAYDRERGGAYRRFTDDDREQTPANTAYGRRMGQGDYARDDRVGERSRSWSERAGAFFTGRDDRDQGRREVRHEGRRRRGPSDRVLWAVIVERLEEERGLDLRDVDVLVDDAEVTLNGTVRRKDDKRRIEDIADIDGVRNVQNNLRVRESGRRWF